MAEEDDDLPEEEHNQLFLQSLKSAATTQPRFSDISRPSDGTIQVDRLKLTPAVTGGDEIEVNCLLYSLLLYISYKALSETKHTQNT